MFRAGCHWTTPASCKRPHVAGLGLAYLSAWQVASDVKAGRLIQVLDEWTPPFPGLCLYYPGRRHVPLGLRALIELIRELKSKSPLH